jgi:hypothetical protein
LQEQNVEAYTPSVDLNSWGAFDLEKFFLQFRNSVCTFLSGSRLGGKRGATSARKIGFQTQSNRPLKHGSAYGVLTCFLDFFQTDMNLKNRFSNAKQLPSQTWERCLLSSLIFSGRT